MAVLNKLSLVLLCAACTCAKAQPTYTWMHPDVSAAWHQQLRGQSTRIIIDDATKPNVHGYLEANSATEYWFAYAFTDFDVKSKAEWGKNVVQILAPSANVYTAREMSFFPESPSKFNIYSSGLRHEGQLADQRVAETSNPFVRGANQNQLIYIKAAGDDAQSLSDLSTMDRYDVHNEAIKDSQSAIFVGVLDRHGAHFDSDNTVPALLNGTRKTNTSNYPGLDKTYQDRFLMVATPDTMSLEGTWAAAPQIAAYAALVSSKFTTARPDQVANLLLGTARKDTIAHYNPIMHGQGEACLSRALAPSHIR